MGTSSHGTARKPPGPYPALQSWPWASLPSLLSLLAHQTSAASSKTRGFPILPASNPSAGAGQKCCSQQVILPPPHSSQEQAAPASAEIREHGHWYRKRHPCPLSCVKKLTADTREGAGRTQVLPHAWDTLPPVTKGQGPGDRECHASRAGQLHKHQCMFTPTSEAWAGDQSWLPAGHPSMHKQPSFLGKCSNFACPRLAPESCPCAGTPLLQNPLFLQEIPFFFVGSIAQPEWPSLSTAQ